MDVSPHVFVAGAGGYIGTALTRLLESCGSLVYGTNQNAPPSNCRIRPVDLLDESSVTQCLGDCSPSHVIHAAGMIGTNDQQALHRAHVETTRVLMRAMAKVCPGAMLTVLGSAAEYGNRWFSTPILEGTLPAPETPYGHSKFLQSELARDMGKELGLAVLRIRLFNIIGPGQGTNLVAGAMIRRLRETLERRGSRFPVFDPESVRDYLDIRDVVRLIWTLAKHLGEEPNGVPVHIASGIGVSVLDLAKELVRVSGSEERIALELVPAPTRTALVGAPCTLASIIGKDGIRKVPLTESLRYMWIQEKYS